MLKKRLSLTSSSYSSSLPLLSKREWGGCLSGFIDTLKTIYPDVVTSTPTMCPSAFKRTYRTKAVMNVLTMIRLKKDVFSADQKQQCVVAMRELLTELEVAHRHKSHDKKVDEVRIALAKTLEALQPTMIVLDDLIEYDLSKVVVSRQPLAQLMQTTALAVPAMQAGSNMLFSALGYVLAAIKADGWDEMALVAEGGGLPQLFPTLIYTGFGGLLLLFGLPNVIKELQENAGEYQELKRELAVRAQLVKNLIDTLDAKFNSKIGYSFKSIMQHFLFTQYENMPSKLEALNKSFPDLNLTQKAFKAWAKNPDRQTMKTVISQLQGSLRKGESVFTEEEQESLENDFKGVVKTSEDLYQVKQSLVAHGLEAVTFFGMGTGMAAKSVGAFLDEAGAVTQTALDLTSVTIGGALLGLGQVACMTAATYDTLSVVTFILRRHFEDTLKGREFTFKDAIKALAKGINWKKLDPELREELRRNKPDDVEFEQLDDYINNVMRDLKSDINGMISRLRSRSLNNTLIFTGQLILFLGIINTFWSLGLSAAVSAGVGGPLTIYAIIKNLLGKAQEKADAKRYPHLSENQLPAYTTFEALETQSLELTRSAVKLSIHRKIAKGKDGEAVVKRWEKSNGYFNKSPFWRAPVANAQAYKKDAMVEIEANNQALPRNKPKKSYYQNYAADYVSRAEKQDKEQKMTHDDFSNVARGGVARLLGHPNADDVTEEEVIRFVLDHQQHPQLSTKIRLALCEWADKQKTTLTHDQVLTVCFEDAKLQKLILDMLYARTMEEIAGLRKATYRFGAREDPVHTFQHSPDSSFLY